jgi:hypothetical protein
VGAYLLRATLIVSYWHMKRAHHGKVSHFRVRKWRFGLEFYISVASMAKYSHGNMGKDLGTLSHRLMHT